LTEESLPEPLDALVNATLAAAGAGIVVYVEGESDDFILSQMIGGLQGQVTFMARGNRNRVKRDLDSVVPNFPKNRLFAIVDRDFAEDADVEPCYHPGFTDYLYVLRRSCIENYLLEPEWILDALDIWYSPKDRPPCVRNAEATTQCLLSWGNRLAPQAAGNWVITDLRNEFERQSVMVSAMGFFEELTDRPPADVLERLKQHYMRQASDLLSEHDIKRRFNSRLEEVQESIRSIEGLHKHVSGKLLLKALCTELSPIKRKKPNWETLSRALAKLHQVQLPGDLSLIVEHMLNRWRRERERASLRQ